MAKKITDKPVKAKVGGNKAIKPINNPKPFTKDYNGANFAKWTEPKVHTILNDLEEWLMRKKPIYAEDKLTIIDYVDAGNVFYKEFLFQERLSDNWIKYVSNKYSTVEERMQHINSIQEHKLQKLSFEGKGKENITKFILTNKYNWKEKTENENKNDNTIIWKEEKTYSNEK